MFKSNKMRSPSALNFWFGIFSLFLSIVSRSMSPGCEKVTLTLHLDRRVASYHCKMQFEILPLLFSCSCKGWDVPSTSFMAGYHCAGTLQFPSLQRWHVACNGRSKCLHSGSELPLGGICIHPWSRNSTWSRTQSIHVLESGCRTAFGENISNLVDLILL